MLTQLAAQHALSHAGVRLTPQRLMIIEVLVGNRTHPSIEAIFQRVRETYPTISLATVYQTLALLARHGLVLELHGGKDGVHCDPETAAHAHAYCEQCGSITDVACPAHAQWAAAGMDGFHPRAVEVSLYGVCASCASVK
ncbi:MAG TPA: Fur family transcriptional regulator [Armatimonadota bacterium]|jgi:Fur family peroxide stress response transcriptional regulator